MCVKQTTFTHFHSMNIVWRYPAASHNANYLISIVASCFSFMLFFFSTLSYIILHYSTWLLSFVRNSYRGISYYCRKQNWRKTFGGCCGGSLVLRWLRKKAKEKKMGNKQRRKGCGTNTTTTILGVWAQSVPYHTWPLRMMDKNS